MTYVCKQHANIWYMTHSEPTSVKVSSIDTLFKVEDALVVLHQAAQFLSQLQSHVLQGGGFCAVHHNGLCGLVERCLLEEEKTY